MKHCRAYPRYTPLPYDPLVPPFVLITGASSGIGEATARRLAAEGQSVILVARRKERLEAIAQELRSDAVEVETHALDVTDTTALVAFFNALSGRTIAAVINNAGLALGKDPLDAADPSDLQRMIDVNVSAFLQVARLSIPHLRASTGHLVNLGSIAGKEVYANGVTYCATKFFVHAVSEGLRQDLAGSGIRVTEIAPGAVDTAFSTVRFKGDVARANAVYEGYEPLHADDIADAICYALSRPAHVNIQHMLIMATAQASATNVARTV